jgi:AAA domain/Primase C terminal 2 (PriCT-2)
MASPRRSFQVFLELPLPPDAARVLNGGGPAITVPDAFKVVPDHLKGQKATNELSSKQREIISAADLKACLAVIPNKGVDFGEWNNLGLEIFAATEGAGYGLLAWEAWSAQNPKYAGGDPGCADAWQGRFQSSPPTRTGAGAIVSKARRALGDPQWLPNRLGAALQSNQVVGNGWGGGGTGSGVAAPSGVVTPWLTAAPRRRRVSHKNRHRRWLYGVDLVRKDITIVAAPGGVGKSTLAIGISTCLATNKELLGEKIWAKNLTALYINGEDPYEELERRIHAFDLKHGITEQELDRLIVYGNDDWEAQMLSLLRTQDKTSVIDDNGIAHLQRLIEEFRPDLVVIDPLINFCGGNINDNAVMGMVMRALKGLATKFDCAIMVVHHTRKGSDLNNQEAVSGAATIVNLARRTITTVPMSLDEAKELAILPSEKWRYFKVVTAKTNMSPKTDDAPWYELTSVTLPNAEPPDYPHGDRVQAVVRAKLSPANKLQLTTDDKVIRRAILDVVQKGKLIGGELHPYSPNPTGAQKKRAIFDDAMAAVRRATPDHQWQPGDLKVVVTRAIDTMIVDGWLVDELIKQGRFRRNRGLRVDWPRTPWPNEKDDESAGNAHDQEVARRTEDKGVAVNWSMTWSMIDQFPRQVVVVNCPPLGGH